MRDESTAMERKEVDGGRRMANLGRRLGDLGKEKFMIGRAIGRKD